jgi:hypothetical protein
MAWSLNDYKRVFCAVGLIGIIVCFLPSGLKLVSSPGEQFSELYVLGPNHIAKNYPFNVSEKATYLVYVGVSNHMGSSEYYEADVKFRNASDSLTNSTVPSSLPPLYEYRVFLGDGQVWEGALTFSFDVNITGYDCVVGRVRANNLEFEMNKPAVWDNATSGFYYQLLVELWQYNQTSQGLSYGGRFVSLWLNMTSTG